MYISSDNDGRRAEEDRRNFYYTFHIPERREGDERRESDDRRESYRDRTKLH